MSRIVTFAATTAALLMFASAGQVTQAQTATSQKPADQAMMADRDEDFIKEVAQASEVEIAASRLAVTKASNAEVKAFAMKLLKNHDAASAELKALVEAKEVTWPLDDPALKARKQKHESLQTLTGAAFDKEYLEDMISDHETAMALFGRYARSAKDAGVKAFAEKNLPALHENLKLARDLRAKIK